MTSPLEGPAANIFVLAVVKAGLVLLGLGSILAGDYEPEDCTPEDM